MLFTFTQKVLFKHCDPAGIVFYPRYFEIINDCIEAFFEQIDHPWQDLHKTAGVPTAQIETTFHKPSQHGDILEFALQLTRIGSASVSTRIHLSCDTEARLSFTSTLVFVDANGTPRPWPGGLRAAMAPYLEGSTK
jgi:4-hydroxybenzoyl-CoA thioesterase